MNPGRILRRMERTYGPDVTLLIVFLLDHLRCHVQGRTDRSVQHRIRSNQVGETEVDEL